MLIASCRLAIKVFKTYNFLLTNSINYEIVYSPHSSIGYKLFRHSTSKAYLLY